MKRRRAQSELQFALPSSRRYPDPTQTPLFLGFFFTSIVRIPKILVSSESKPIQALFLVPSTMAFSVSSQQLAAFHSIDRRVYSRLVFELGLQPNLSKRIVAFWYLLERGGLKNFIKNLLSLPRELLNRFATEAIISLAFLYEKLSPTWCIDLDRDTPLMGCLVGQGLCLTEIFQNKGSAVIVMERFVKDVCDKVFGDAVAPSGLGGLVRKQPGVSRGEEYQGPVCSEGEENALRHSRSELVGEKDDVAQYFPADSEIDRTLFTTFSKGHPISKEELRDLITGRFGNCVEAIYMKCNQPLYARVVLKSASAMEKMMGEEVLVKLNTNGKDVWARRFVLKNHNLDSLVG